VSLKSGFLKSFSEKPKNLKFGLLRFYRFLQLGLQPTSTVLVDQWQSGGETGQETGEW